MGDLLSGKRRVRPDEGFLMAAVYGAASMTIFLLLGIIGYVFFRGFRIVSLRFLLSVTD